MTADMHIESEVHGKCIEETSDHRLVLKTCNYSARAQTWMFDPDSRVAGVQ
jgi:hypothetical protein